VRLIEDKQLDKQFKKVVMTELCLSESGKMRKQLIRDVINMPEQPDKGTEEQPPTQTGFSRLLLAFNNFLLPLHI
jgi:hypothetical protein